MLSNYNIKYICTIYTRLDTCLMSISRFSLRDKATLRPLKLHFYGADVVEWSRALDTRLGDWCCSVSMVGVQIPSREEQKFDSSKIKNLILTLFGLIFRRIYIFVYIYNTNKQTHKQARTKQNYTYICGMFVEIALLHIS